MVQYSMVQDSIVQDSIVQDSMVQDSVVHVHYSAVSLYAVGSIQLWLWIYVD